MPDVSVILPWALVGLLLGVVIGGVRQYRLLLGDHELLRQRFTDEKSAHYQTHRTLIRRERQLGALLRQLEGMAEIAQGSAQLAQLHKAMMAEARAGESLPVPLDEAR